MKHLCSCGEIVEAEGTPMLIATCIKCGSYYLYPDEVKDPGMEKVIAESKTSDIFTLQAETPYVIREGKNIPVEPKPKPRPAQRR